MSLLPPGHHRRRAFNTTGRHRRPARPPSGFAYCTRVGGASLWPKAPGPTSQQLRHVRLWSAVLVRSWGRCARGGGFLDRSLDDPHEEQRNEPRRRQRPHLRLATDRSREELDHSSPSRCLGVTTRCVARRRQPAQTKDANTRSPQRHEHIAFVSAPGGPSPGADDLDEGPRPRRGWIPGSAVRRRL
jgi:hypothetical protein